MKVVHRSIAKNGEGRVGLIPEDPDDLWYVYNLIQKGDRVQAQTWRKVVNETSTGSTGSYRVKMNLAVVAEKIQYDTEANIIKVKGKNVQENRFVKLGQYHTIDLELSQRFFLDKPLWDSWALTQLRNACDTTRNSEVAVVIMQEGLAYVCLLTTNMSVQKSKIEVNIPRKRKNFCSQHQKGLDNFFEQIMQSMIRCINFEVIKCVIVASPGFVKDLFMTYFWQQATKRENKVLIESKHKFLTAHSSSGFKHSIREILSNPEIQTQLEDTKAVKETMLWNEFQLLLGSAPNKAIYGLKEVEVANESNAICNLMISDSLFRSSNLTLRNRYSSLIHSVKSKGADVRIFSAMHQTGEQLNQLTGLAAILKFEVLELQQMENIAATCHPDESSDSDSDSTTDSSSISSDR